MLDQRALELTGLVDEDGLLHRHLPSPSVHVPLHVWLEHENGQDLLAYRWHPWDEVSDLDVAYASPDPRHVPSDGAATPHQGFRGSKRCLDGFLKLAGTPDKVVPNDQILAFARQWGVLGICAHGLPATHNPPSTGLEVEETSRGGCLWLVTDSGQWCEPVDVWRHLAEQANQLVRMAIGLHQRRHEGKTVLPEEWDQLMLQAMWWLTVGDVRPFVFWNNERDKPSVMLGSAQMPKATVPDEGWGTLFGLIATQLTFVVAGADGFDWCDGCHSIRPVEERPRIQGHFWYCSECRVNNKKMQTTNRQRRWRDQKRTKAQKGEDHA